ncbi:MAG TPA: helix-turn-helix domain-containing protein [Thermoplasmatales archaeon]|nr:helix-turn-helix domain-containing protein [Thermoplasmatales archaeon]
MRIKERLAEKIAGEITLSPQPGKTIRKWREIFQISQTELARALGISPSVLSDYESGRRKSPGIKNIKRIVEALFEIDEKTGGRTIHKYTSMMEMPEGILEIMEYPYPIPATIFIEEIDGKVVNSPTDMEKKSVKGFTLVDSIKTIKTISSEDFTHLYGWSTERALVFTGIQYGRSPMIAVRVHPMKPTIVVYHKPNAIDNLAIKLADTENIPLVVTEISLDELIKRLISLREKEGWS